MIVVAGLSPYSGCGNIRAPKSHPEGAREMRQIDRERAKSVIVEIIRRSGGTLRNKTNLFKAFWKAHVAAAAHGRALSDYPIVRMPNGPGIHDFDRLFGELLTAGVVHSEMDYSGQYPAFVFTIADDSQFISDLSDEDVEDVNAGVRFVEGKTAGELSLWSHDHSRSWNLSRDGQELDIVLDAIPPEETAARAERRQTIRSIVQECFR